MKGMIKIMKRLTIFSAIAVILIMAFGISVIASAGSDEAIVAVQSWDIVLLKGNYVPIRSYKIFDNNYFKLRDIAWVLSSTPSRFDIMYDGKTDTINIITGKEYAGVEGTGSDNLGYKHTAKDTTSKIKVDGVSVDIKGYNINGNNFYKLRDLGEALGFDITWDGSNNRINILPGAPDNAYKVETSHEITSKNRLTTYFPRWKSQLSSYIIDNKDGTISIIEPNMMKEGEESKNIITIDTYDKEYNLVDSKEIEFELPLFGGFFSEKNYNYIAFGQTNKEENDNKEVIRIVKYDKDFNPIDKASIKGGESYTVVPFDAGSGKMDKYGNMLVFHTSRERYTTEDGLNHQSQLTIFVNTSTMTAINYMGRFQSNHVSHSFDQYVLFDGSTPIYLDHGDAYPRSVVLTKGDLGETSGTYRRDPRIDLFKIPGRTGANATGVLIGGFEISSKNYIVAMNTVDHSLVEDYTSFQMVGLDYDQRDVLVAVTPRAGFGSGGVKHITHGKYVGTDKNSSVPQLVKITDDKLVLMWQEHDREGQPLSVKYVLIDENGEALGQVKEVKDFLLSECKPIVVDNKLVWYTNDAGERIIYTIPLS